MTRRAPTIKIHPNIFMLFHKRFEVRVPQGQVRSIDEQAARPSLSSGDKAVDRALSNAHMTVWCTVNQMLDYYREGVGIYIVKIEDVCAIYEAVTSHLDVWHLIMRTSLNTGNAPAQDFIDLGKFASSFYEIAKGVYFREPLNPFMRAFGRTFAAPAQDIVYNRPRVEEKPAAVDIRDVHYNPNDDVFKQALLNQQRNTRG